MHLPPGTVIDDRFTVVAAIGSGGMGVVVRARQVGLDRDVALKFLRADIAPKQSDVARFEQEAHILSGFHHKNIVNIYGFGKWQDAYFMALEYLPGKSLQDLLDDGNALEPDFALHVFKQICAGLSAAHAQGIIHRDLKPSNVLITDDGTAKLIDFGFSRLLPQPNQMEQHLTEPGTTLGTVSYMAPEQCTGEATDARSDIYSAGAMLYHMLTGQVALDADTPVAIMYRHVNESFPALEADDERIMQFAPIIAEATQTDPTKRYQSIDEMATAVNALTASLGQWSKQSSVAQRASLKRHRGKHPRALPDNVIIALLAVPIIAAMLFLIESRTPQHAPQSVNEPQTFHAWRMQGDEQANHYQWNDALGSYQHCLAYKDAISQQELATIYYSIAGAYYGSGDFELGDNTLKNSIATPGLEEDAKYSLVCHYATALAKRGLYDQAHKVISAIPFSRISRWAIRNDNAGVLPAMYEHIHQRQNALDICDMTTAYTKMKDIDQLRAEKAAILLADHRYKEAIDTIEDMAPEHASALSQAVLAVAYRHLGNTAASTVSARQAQRMIAHPRQDQNKLGFVCMKVQDQLAQSILNGATPQ